MKKSSHSSKPKTKASPRRKDDLEPPENPLVSDNPVQETNLADEQFSVISREDEATTSGHRVEPIEVGDEEHNAETLIEEGLHGYLHAVSKKSRRR